MTDGATNAYSIQAFSYIYLLIYNLKMIEDVVKMEDAIYIDKLYEIVHDKLVGKFSPSKLIYYQGKYIEHLKEEKIDCSHKFLESTLEDKHAIIYGFVKTNLIQINNEMLGNIKKSKLHKKLLIGLVYLIKQLDLSIKGKGYDNITEEKFKSCIEFFKNYKILFYAFKLNIEYFFVEVYSDSIQELSELNKISTNSMKFSVDYIMRVKCIFEYDISRWQTLLTNIYSKSESNNSRIIFSREEFEPTFEIIRANKELMALILDTQYVIRIIKKFNYSMIQEEGMLNVDKFRTHSSQHLQLFRKDLIFSLWDDFHFNTLPNCTKVVVESLPELLHCMKVISSGKSDILSCIPLDYVKDYLDKYAQQGFLDLDMEAVDAKDIKNSEDTIMKKYQIIYKDYMFFEFLIFICSIHLIKEEFGHSITSKDSQDLLFYIYDRLIRKYLIYKASGIYSKAHKRIEYCIKIFSRAECPFIEFNRDLDKVPVPDNFIKKVDFSPLMIDDISNSNIRYYVSKMKVNNTFIGIKEPIVQLCIKSGDRRLLTFDIMMRNKLNKLCEEISKDYIEMRREKLSQSESGTSFMNCQRRNFNAIFESTGKNIQEINYAFFSVQDQIDSEIYVRFKYFYFSHIKILGIIYKTYFRNSNYRKKEQIALLEWILFQLKNIRPLSYFDLENKRLNEVLRELIEKIEAINCYENCPFDEIQKKFEMCLDIHINKEDKELFQKVEKKMITKFHYFLIEPNFIIDSIMEI